MYKFICIVVTLLFASTFLQAQSVRVDKTTSDGRIILTKEKDYYGAGRDDKLSLHYIREGETEYFLMTIDFDEEGKSIYEGYKMLLKQASGNIMELTCVYGEHKDVARFSFFHPIYTDIEPYENSNFQLSRNQVESIINDPVVKIRMEYNQGYFDIDPTTKTTGKSKFSEYLRAAYSEINNALENKKTGLYDGF